jgi:hypothetical protein
MDRKPFSKSTLRRYCDLSGKNYFTPEPNKSKNLVSPNLRSKLSPSLSLTKSPYIRERFGIHGLKFEQSKNLLLKYITKPNELINSPIPKVTIKKNSMTALKFAKLMEDDIIPTNQKAKSKEISPDTTKLKSLSSEDQE